MCHSFKFLLILIFTTLPINPLEIGIDIGIGSPPEPDNPPPPEPSPEPKPDCAPPPPNPVCPPPLPPPPPPEPVCPPPPPPLPPPPPPEPVCPPPPPPPHIPQPSDFPNLSQYFAYKTIQRFKKTITCDPKNITATWNGFRPCSYTGFACETPPGLTNTPKIAAVDFNQFKLCAPTISNFIDQLPDLAIFHVNSNKFGGTVPDLRNLTFLYELDLSNNILSGAFPSTLLPLNQLIFLDIRFNRFSGSVPFKIFKLPVDVLFLNNNAFSRSLPSDFGLVRYLTLANNGFKGPIPGSLCNSSNNLVEVLLLNNKLSGCLPYEVGLLKKATVFDVGNNRVTGPIPLSFGCLRKVEQLNLAGNLLYGKVPDVVCDLAKCGRLVNLSLSGNYFTAIGDSCWGLVKSGVLDLRRNCIPGLANQRSVRECASFIMKCNYCPLNTFMPCAPPGHYNLGSDGPASQSEKSGSVTYSAVHSRHGL